MSTRIYLTIDFGSTYTKLTAIDLDKEEIIATSRAMTTIKTDVLTGFNEAFEELKKDLDKKLKNYKIIKKVACSSAAGGLKIIAIGLVPELTTEAAKKAALSSGARVIKTYAFDLTDKDINEISNLHYDILHQQYVYFHSPHHLYIFYNIHKKSLLVLHFHRIFLLKFLLLQMNELVYLSDKNN